MSSPAAVVPTTPLEIRVDQSVPVLVVPEEMKLETLRAWVRERLPEHAASIGGRTARLDLGCREINLFDLRRLIHLLRHEFSIDITGLYVRPEAITRFAERELKLKLFVPVEEPPLEEQDTEELVDGFDLDEAEADEAPNLAALLDDDSDVPEPHAIDQVRIPHDLKPEDLAAAPAREPAAPPEPPSAPQPTPIPLPPRQEGRRTKTIQRTLRSGAEVQFDGDLFVYGDINPGAHVVASGNIVVLGALKGMAHAGAAGDEKAFILAFDLRPTQVRIGRKIAIPPDRSAESFLPEIAKVNDEQIVIEAYRGRFPRR